ncbi:hypothetical protein PsSCT_29430 [Pseudomonas sp. SCT]
MGFYESGFTQGPVGFGVDAYGYLGIRLDSGGGRTGTFLVPVGSDGEPEKDWSEAGGVVKLRWSNTVLKYGEQRFGNPVVGTGDARLLPETATGFVLTSEEIEGLALDAGRFTAMNRFDSTNSDDELLIQYASDVGDAISWAGGLLHTDRQPDPGPVRFPRRGYLGPLLRQSRLHLRLGRRAVAEFRPQPLPHRR